VEDNNKMREDLSTLKSGQKLLEYRADQTDKVIGELSDSVKKLHKDLQPIGDQLKWLVRAGIFYVISDTIGFPEAIKLIPKLIGV